ncbi:MAG: helix-turn-helix transcriptional regulator [Luteolibacter sp.]
MSDFFTERLAVAIAKSGKSKGSLAKHCGVALSTVSRWLKGSIPKADTILEIATFLGVDAKWLFPTSNELKDLFASMGVLDAESAWVVANEASYELGIERRARELAAESESEFAVRINALAEKAKSTLSDAIVICETIREAKPDSSINILDLPSVAELSHELFQLSDEIGRIKAESLALRHLAESSPAMLKMLRKK